MCRRRLTEPRERAGEPDQRRRRGVAHDRPLVGGARVLEPVHLEPELADEEVERPRPDRTPAPQLQPLREVSCVRQQQLHLGPLVLRGGNGGANRGRCILGLESVLCLDERLELLERALHGTEQIGGATSRSQRPRFAPAIESDHGHTEHPAAP